MHQFNAAHWFLPEDGALGFVHIPAGTFWMGSNDLSEDESPLHELDMAEYWISRYPITTAQYQVFAVFIGKLFTDPFDSDTTKESERHIKACPPPAQSGH